MQVRPVDRYPQPKLPTRAVIDQHPELLRLLPKRWQQNAAVMGALAACVALSGCAKKASHAPSRVAPIFVHGDGVGAYGCVAINPPVFLSEDEARKVIVDEAKKAGISFGNDGKVLPSVRVPVTARWPFREDVRRGDEHPKKRTQTRPLGLDGVDNKRQIAFEFVSEDDYLKWEAKTSLLRLSTASFYDLLPTAKDLRSGIVRAKPAGAYAVFYDPCIGWQDARGKNYEPDWGNPKGIRAELARVEASAKGIAREQLRAQVKDFIKWLKAQGVI